MANPQVAGLITIVNCEMFAGFEYFLTKQRDPTGPPMVEEFRETSPGMQ